MGLSPDHVININYCKNIIQSDSKVAQTKYQLQKFITASHYVIFQSNSYNKQLQNIIKF